MAGFTLQTRSFGHNAKDLVSHDRKSGKHGIAREVDWLEAVELMHIIASLSCAGEDDGFEEAGWDAEMPPMEMRMFQ